MMIAYNLKRYIVLISVPKFLVFQHLNGLVNVTPDIKQILGIQVYLDRRYPVNCD